MAGEHWSRGTLGDIAEIKTGKLDSNAAIAGGRFPFFTCSPDTLKIDTVAFDCEAAILAGNNANGVFAVKYFHGKFNAYQRTYVITSRDRERVDIKYLYYQLQQITTLLQEYSIGTATKFLTRTILDPLAIPLPPLAEQKAIAAMLGALDDKIELNRRMNATLEAMARALFQSWFVDFDPVRAKLDGRLPAALDAATAALFPEHFGHGEDGILPLGWRQTTIEEVCAVNASTLGKNDDLETLEYVEISEVIRGNIANIATYTRGDEPSRARRRLRHGDTVLSTVRPDRGSYFLALNPPDNRVASTGFAVITPTKVPWSFLHAALTQPEVSKHLGQMADGGAYPAVRPEIIGAMKVGLPDDTKILEAFHRTCAPLFEQAEANRAQSRTLATLRDTLLPKLLSGELSVASPL
jgi:type I restriction enzyme S subunit